MPGEKREYLLSGSLQHASLPSLWARPQDHQTTRRVRSQLHSTAHRQSNLPGVPRASPPPTTSHRFAPRATPPCRNLLQSPGILCSLVDCRSSWAPGHHLLRRASAGAVRLVAGPAMQFGRLSPPRSTSPSQTRQSSRRGRQLRQLRQGLKRPKRSRALPHGCQCQKNGWRIPLRARPAVH